jgi:hypothetical protein
MVDRTDCNLTNPHRPTKSSGNQDVKEVQDVTPLKGGSDNVARPGEELDTASAYTVSSTPYQPKTGRRPVMFIPTEDVEKEHAQLLAEKKAEAHAKAWPAAVDLSTFPTREDFEPEYNGQTYVDRVISHVASYAMRLLNIEAEQGDQKLSLGEIQSGRWSKALRLSDALAEYIQAEGAHALVSAYDRDSKAGEGSLYILWERLSEFCDARAAFALREWKPDYQAKLSEAGRRGGEISKRPKVWTPDMLDPYLGLTKAQQMEALGASVLTGEAPSMSSVKRMRRGHPFYAKD